MMELFMSQLATFNPYWLGGSVLFGFFLGHIFRKPMIFFVPMGYLLFILPTIKAEEWMTTSGLGREFVGMAREWNMSPFDATSLLVALAFVMVTGVFWALANNQ